MNEIQPTYLKLAAELKRQEDTTLLPEGLSFDDIKILPGRSIVKSPSEVQLTSTLANGIKLEVPIISANMDSVTEEEMAIAMALNGGIGAIHRALTIDEEVRIVEETKESHQYVIDQPAKLTSQDTVGKAREMMEKNSRGYVVIVDEENKLHGIVTKRDLHPRFVTNDDLLSENIVTSNQKGLVTAPPDITIEAAQRMMWENRIEKLILIDSEGNVGGVITDRDIQQIQRYPQATRDQQGRLQVLASVGIGKDAEERADALVNAGADGIIIDVLHGDSEKVKYLTRLFHSRYHIPIISGNAGTDLEAVDLFEAGADVVKMGYGPGSFCTTQVVTGTGAAQWSAIIKSAAVAHRLNKQIIADGGIRAGGDIAKALAGGAAAVMLGGILVGTDKSPGELLRDEQGRLYKIGRGSASKSASVDFAKSAGTQNKKRAAQGVEGIKVPYTGTTEDLVFDLKDGVQHGIANAGGNNIPSFRNVVRFERQSIASYNEGRPHIKS